jgi:hypothetical protein
MKLDHSSSLINAFHYLAISPRAPCKHTILRSLQRTTWTKYAPMDIHGARAFSATSRKDGNWLEPSLDRTRKMAKGRVRVATGGSVKGTTVAWGDFGLRMKDHDRRISAKQLKVAESTIKDRLRGEKYRLYARVCCNVGVFVSGNEVCCRSTAKR